MSPHNNSAHKGLISVNNSIHYTMETKHPKQILLPGFSNEENKQKIPGSPYGDHGLSCSPAEKIYVLRHHSVDNFME